MDICRVCLSSEADKHLYQLKTNKNNGNKGYSEILQFCLDIQVSEDLEASRKLCSKCYRKIKSFYKFKSMALINDAYFKSLRQETLVKRELDQILIASEPCLAADSHGLDNMKREKGDEDVGPHETKNVITKNEQSDTSNDTGSDAIDGHSREPMSSIETETSILNQPVTCENPVKSKRNKIHKNSDKTSTKTIGYEEALKKSCTNGPGICDQCGVSVKNLKLHIVVHIPKPNRQRYPCNKCEKTFSTYTSRKVHENRWHLGKIGHCDICNKDFLDMKSHQLIMHDRDKLPLQCGVCQLRFRHQSALDNHITNHTKEKSFQCDLCGKNFRLKLLLSQHVRSVHEQEKNYVCQHCSKAFFKKYHFTNHLRTHTKERPYKCPQCAKCFTTTSTLKDHQYSHTTLRDHHCSLCTMSFVKAANLRKHMLSHSSEKKFPCRYCGVAFKRSSPRKKHEYEKHEKNMLANNEPG